LVSDNSLSGDEAIKTRVKKTKLPAKKAAPVAEPDKEPKQDYGNLRKGVDIIDEDVSTDRAYTVFRELERDEAMREFKPPRIAETGGMAGVGDSRFA